MKAALPRFLQSGVVLTAFVFIIVFFYTALPRFLYPYDLDFLEDSIFMESWQMAQGRPVYGPPNADFNPHVYMPLFFWLGAGLLKIGGPSLVLLRSISFGATLVITILIYFIALRESGRHWIAIACAGLLIGGYSISGFWYEVARVDSLFVMLMLSGFALANYAGSSNWRLFLSAVVLGLAALTKQTGFIVGIGLALYLFLRIGRRAWAFLIPWSVITIVPLFILNGLTKGWFFYHIFYIGSADPIEPGRLINFATKELFGLMAGLSLSALLAVIFGAKQFRLKVLHERPWLIEMGLAIVISALGRMRVGGNVNNLMPVYVLLCLAPAILTQLLPSPSSTQTVATASNHWRNWLVAILILTQFFLGRYSPARYIPSPAMKQANERLIQRIASIEGPVLVMMHPYYTFLAGKEPSTQIATLWYVRHRGDLPLPDDFVNRIQNHYYSAIVSDESFFETQPDLHKLILTYYIQSELLNPSQAASTLTGVVVRPKLIYRPKQP